MTKLKSVDIRLVHAGDLTTNQAHALVWNEGSIASRYQELAIAGDRVIGSWQYEIEWHRGRATIDSSHTGVAHRFRRRGIAQTLWMHGMARWKPARIKATIGTDEGRDFLARMMARIAYVSPETFLWVKTRESDTDWDAQCEYAGRELLRKLGKERVETTTKKLAKHAPALLKAAS